MTEMNRAQVVIGCRSVTHPGGFHYGKFLAEHTLLYVYAMCYSCLAPLILPAGFSACASVFFLFLDPTPDRFGWVDQFFD